MDNIIEMAVNMVDHIPETNIYKALSTHFKNPLYAKRKEREFKPKFSMDELYKQSESTVNYKIVGDYKYVLTPYCLMGEDDEVYPILIKIGYTSSSSPIRQYGVKTYL